MMDQEFYQTKYITYEGLSRYNAHLQISALLVSKRSRNVGVTRVAPVSASVEACRVVGGCLSMSQFFGKISYLNIFSLIFGNSYQ